MDKGIPELLEAAEGWLEDVEFSESGKLSLKLGLSCDGQNLGGQGAARQIIRCR